MSKKSLDKITPQQIAELQLEAKAMIDYLYMIFFSLDQIQFRARLAGEIFYDNVIKRADHILQILGEDEMRQKRRIQRIKKRANDEHEQTQGKTFEERHEKISKIIKVTSKVAVGFGIARLMLGGNTTS